MNHLYDAPSAPQRNQQFVREWPGTAPRLIEILRKENALIEIALEAWSKVCP